jgi:segregation and condensation protein A
MATAIRDSQPPDGPGIPVPEAGEPPTPYTVRLPQFEGPLDLLLHLIEKNQLEITTISLVAVTDQFIAYVHESSEPPLPRMAEFVAMAARLLLIKSRSLLPRQPRNDEMAEAIDPLEDAEQLRLHLIEYKSAREIARALKDRDAAGLHSFVRVARLTDPETLLAWSPPQLVGLNVQALAAVFTRVLAQKRMSEPETVPLPLVTVAEKIAEIEALLMRQDRTTLEEVLMTTTSRFAVVVTFLAVLELWHQERIAVVQEHLFGPVLIERGPRFGQKVTSISFDPEQATLTPEPENMAKMPPSALPGRTRKKRDASEYRQAALEMDKAEN